MSGSGIAGNQGSSSFDALELLADPERLQSKIDQLRAAEEAAQKQIALAGPAGEILQIRSEIEGLKELAEVTLAGARDDANEILDKANSDAAFLRERAKEESDAARDQADNTIAGAKKLADDATAAMAAVESKKREVAGEIDNLNSLGESLQQKADALDERANELKGKEDQLVKVRELINTVV
tara:strand:- start:110 stop:658 length:549 start_codon:yes stop_codon:yes gene_type:complete